MADKSVRFFYDDGRTLGFAAVVAGYTAIGGAFDYPAVEVLIQNLTDKTVSISTDGITENFKLPANSFREVDIASNKQNGMSASQPVGTMYYVKRVGTPTTGTVDISMAYLG